MIFVGGGPTALYGALELSRKMQSNLHFKILIIEKGNSIENRLCSSIERRKSCQNCSICNITSGLGGAGLASDGKFPITNNFGGNLWEKIGKEKALELMYKVDEENKKCFLKSHTEAEWPKLFSSKDSSFKMQCTQCNLHLLDADIRHLGTDYGKEIYTELIKQIKANGVEILVKTTVTSIQVKNDSYQLNTSQGESFLTKQVVVAAGRTGSKWVKQLCDDLNIPTKSNRVDIGIRFECPNEIWNHVTKELYESKIIYRTKTYEDLVRTFCMNPGGAVVTENSDNGITVNGHSFENSKLKTENTNFALLVSKTFTDPFNDSSAYGEAIVSLSNMLGGGVIVQRYGDLIRGKRSTKSRILENTVRSTLNAEPGDLSLVLPKRILDDILEMIEALAQLVPGMKNDDNLLYGVEIKKYNNVVEVDSNLQSNKGIYFGGDGSGWTHSLSQASASGLYIAEKLLEKFSRD